MLNSQTEIKSLSLAGKDNFDDAMKRIYAWYECEVIDRPPVKFATHNAQYNVESTKHYTPEQWKQRWFDTEAVVEGFIKSIQGRQFLAENFPVYWPNIGPDAYASFYGCDLTYGEVTSWSHPIIKTWEDLDKIQLDMECEYLKKIDELTAYALQRCEGKFLVGYTDLHPGIDCALAWRGMEQLCFDLLEAPDKVKEMIDLACRDFVKLFDYFGDTLKKYGQPSVTWMEIPSFGKLHIPSADFATMMSPTQFNELVLPIIQSEVRHADHNVFHLDGKGVANHIDTILEIPEVQAIQWVQGVGDDQPIMQWLPLIRNIQDKGKAVIVDLQKDELEEFISQMRPEGLFLWIAEDNIDQQKQLIKRLEKW
jgi:hypothetical protein